MCRILCTDFRRSALFLEMPNFSTVFTVDFQCWAKTSMVSIKRLTEVEIRQSLSRINYTWVRSIVALHFCKKIIYLRCSIVVLWHYCIQQPFISVRSLKHLANFNDHFQLVIFSIKQFHLQFLVTQHALKKR